MISDNKITGTVLYQDGTGELEAGNYLVLFAEAPTGTVTVNGESSDDGVFVVEILDKTEPLVITAVDDGWSQAETYDLSGLTLNEE